MKMIKPTDLKNRMIHSGAPLNRLAPIQSLGDGRPAEALDKAGRDATRSETIAQIVKLSEPSQPQVFAASLKRWTDAALAARLKTLQAQDLNPPDPLPRASVYRRIHQFAALLCLPVIHYSLSIIH
jgi:hypothetical protein